MKLLEIRDLSLCYEDTVALHDVNLDVYMGDFLGVIGPNGGGKTSLVRAILGLVTHTGKITYFSDIEQNKRKNIGYMPQISELDKTFPISVREVVLSGLQAIKGVWGRYTSNDRYQADQLLELCGIGSIALRPIGELSGGQLQRTLLCRALMANPKLLILDEPTNFVDNQFEKELYKLLKELNERMAIMMVSHDLGTISSHVKSIVCVNGQVHQHNSNVITAEQLAHYDCPIQVVYHGEVPHTVLERHP